MTDVERPRWRCGMCPDPDWQPGGQDDLEAHYRDRHQLPPMRTIVLPKGRRR